MARYDRQLRLPQVGEEGQKKLKEASVLVVGLGGLGSSAALYLAGAGIGSLGLMDGDRVELSDLHRQILYRTGDLGRPKTEAAEETLTALNPTIRVNPVQQRLENSQASAIIDGHDLVCDCSDNLETRLVINAACHRLKKPFCHGGLRDFQGQVTTFHTREGTPCYRCLYAPGSIPAMTEDESPPGVMGPLAGVIGSLQAMEAVKVLLGFGDLLHGSLLILDMATMETLRVPYSKREGCEICGSAASSA